MSKPKKEKLITRWREKAEVCYQLAEISTTESAIYNREAYAYTRCADELQLLIDRESEKPEHCELVKF